MARARNIKPGFFKNADLVELTMEARLLFIGLWTMADRAGRLEDRPKQIKIEVFPADAVDIDACLDDLQRMGFVKRYEVAGRRLLQVVNFKKHQSPHKDEKPSELPEPDASAETSEKEHGASTVQAPCPTSVGTVVTALNEDCLIPDSRTLSADDAADAAPTAEPEPVTTIPTMAGAVCITLKAKLIPDVNPSHPELLALLKAGVDIGTFAAAAESAVQRGKGKFAYVLAMVKGQAADSQRMAANARASPQPQNRKDRQLETAGLLTGASRPAIKPLETIDVESRILPA